MWIDRFVEFQSKRSAKAIKNLSAAEDHFRDHFPGYPVMPGSLILEGLAQTGGILVGEAYDFKEKVVLAKIAKARFHREALAGEQLTYAVEVLDLRPEGATIQGQVTSDGQPVAEAEIMFAHLDKARSQQMFGDHNFVFSGELQKLIGLAKLLPRSQAPPGNAST
jgi:3-hydroxyacyl-[acyl-carrier-protein] dehydratase